MWAKRGEGWRSFCSSSAMLWPVSTAVELATARITALRLGFLRWGSVALSMMGSCRLRDDTLPKFSRFAAAGKARLKITMKNKPEDNQT